MYSRLVEGFLAVLLASTVVGAPTSEVLEKRQSCTDLLQRRAWHTLNGGQKREYIEAELCLMYRTHGTSGLPAVQSRFDDLIALHQTQSENIHNDGWFLPFHRLHMHAHEKLLRTECGYTGAQPYWDEAAEAGQFTSSVVFRADNTGFGGDGVREEGNSSQWQRCIGDGPFANYTLHNGPGQFNIDHCITRQISNQASLLSSQSEIDICLGKPNFAEAWPCIEKNPHLGGHSGVGGEMMNSYSSPGDLLFYLHHTFLDRVWWQWQERELPDRFEDIAGYTTGSKPPSGWVLATLDDELDMGGVIPNATIREIMDTRGGVLCYEYV